MIAHVNRFRNQFFLTSALSKVIFWFSAVFNMTEIVIIGKNMMTISEYTMKIIIISVIEHIRCSSNVKDK